MNNYEGMFIINPQLSDEDTEKTINGIQDEIKKNNPAAGLGLGGILIALGIILKGSIQGPFTGWANDLVSFIYFTIYGIVMLLIFRLVIDKILLPTTKLAIEIEEDQNVAALLMTESVIVGTAIIIAFSM